MRQPLIATNWVQTIVHGTNQTRTGSTIAVEQPNRIVHEQKPKSFSAKALNFWADVDKFWTDPYALSESQYWRKLKLNLMVDEKILLLLLLLLVHYI